VSDRFTAEEILRAAASGQIPAEGQFLVRGADGWLFRALDEDDLDIDFGDLGIDRLLLPSEIAYEDEVNVFTLRNTFSDFRAPDHEAWVRFSRR
jgi:hypothetical protein